MTAPHLCPRCQTALSPHRLESHLIRYDSETCLTCKGVFLGEVQLQQVESTQMDSLVEFRRIPTPEAQKTPLSCPRCKTTMTKVVSARDAEVVMDVCETCRHTWLDGGELEAIKVDGFLDNARGLFRSLR